MLSSALLKDIYQNKLESENRIYLIISSGALLAIILSFVGMFALSVYNVEKRTKEIGIRKVNGSTSWQILVLFLKDILKWVVLAMIPAFLTATIFLQSWLSEFSNHLRLSITHYVVAGIISLLIASLAILVKSVQAARQNPVKSLKYE
jgi:putative ABC transport system permease protein